MVDNNNITVINRVIQAYFDTHPNEAKVPAKDLMPQFIAAGIFPSDHRNGLSIRKVLRELDSKKQLKFIPSVLPERKAKNTNWFFARNDKEASLSVSTVEKPSIISNSPTRDNSDECYVLDLCDLVLGQKGIRQHRFDFLRGDVGKNGKRVKLPVDAYYPDLDIVIEYRERQHTTPVKHFDKPGRITVSGVHRGEQRKIYDRRRREVLPKHGIQLVEIPYSIFSCSGQCKIIRNSKKDLLTVKDFLK